MDGLFLELGPFKLRNGEILLNDHSWHKSANLLFLDQPVGTGLSYTNSGTYAKNDNDVNEQFYNFLVNFLKLHENLASRDIYLAGESHAGHYIPCMIKYIIEKNGISQKKINVKGTLIGNPWLGKLTT